MKRLLHHLRRDRTYSSRERWGVFATLGILTVAVSLGSVVLFGRPVASATSLKVADIALSSEVLQVSDQPTGTATITLVDKKTDQPAGGVWVGLLVTNPVQRSAQFTYLDWYSPEPNRAFYQTDSIGQVKFALASGIPGEITYKVYVANPNLKNDNKYQDLEDGFAVRFE